MTKRVFNCANPKCGATTLSYSSGALYCSRECSSAIRKLPRFAPHEYRFHVYRAGCRNALARYLRLSPKVIYRDLPIDHVDDMLHGRMINIGGILAKRCSRCGVTRELEHFHNDASTSHGVAAHCVVCDKKRRIA